MPKILNGFYSSKSAPLTTSDCIESPQPKKLTNTLKTHGRRSSKYWIFSMIIERSVGPKRLENGNEDADTPLEAILPPEPVAEQVCLLRDSPFRILRIKSECPLCKQKIESVLHNIESVDKFETFVVPERRRRRRFNINFGTYLINSYSFLRDVTPAAVSDFATRVTGTDFINQNIFLNIETARNTLEERNPTVAVTRSAINNLNHNNNAGSNYGPSLNSNQRRYFLQRSIVFRPRSRRNAPSPHGSVIASSSNHNIMVGHQSSLARIRAQRDDNARWWNSFRAQHRRLQDLLQIANRRLEDETNRMSSNIAHSTSSSIANAQTQTSGIQVRIGTSRPINTRALAAQVNAVCPDAINGCPRQRGRVGTFQFAVETLLDSLVATSRRNPLASAVAIPQTTNSTVPTNMPANMSANMPTNIEVQGQGQNEVQGEDALIRQEENVAQDQQPMEED